MKAFVTGATGFIGGRLVRRLVERGDSVYALVRSPGDADKITRLGATPVIGDITERESMREGMRGAEVVFHVAGWFKVGARDASMAEAVNVTGTRNVLELAQELGVPRVVYTSTIALFGDTHGKLVDESFPESSFEPRTQYDRTKGKAHTQVALPMIEQGAPVIIVMPGMVVGPGDQSLVGQLLEAWYKGYFPIFPAPEMTLTIAHVDDIVEGHLLAAEKGRVGEMYILTGPVYNLRELLHMSAQMTGRPAPMLYLPAPLVKPFAPLMGALSQFAPVPPMFSQDAISLVDTTYIARADKARKELGWQVRPVRESLRDIFDHFAQTTPTDPPETIKKKQQAGLALAVAALLWFWLVFFRKRN